jgi:hypothetical protein
VSRSNRNETEPGWWGALAHRDPGTLSRMMRFALYRATAATRDAIAGRIGLNLECRWGPISLRSIRAATMAGMCYVNDVGTHLGVDKSFDLG